MMIKTSLFVLTCIVLTGCVQSASKKPLLGTESGASTIGIVNAYPNEISLFVPGITIFQNKYLYRKPDGWNISDYIEENVTAIISDVPGVKINEFQLSDEQINRLQFKQDESVFDYENKVKNLPSILAKANDQQIDQLMIITQSFNVIPNADIFTHGTGLWYFLSGTVEPYSSFAIYILDTMTNEIIGKHDLKSHGEIVLLENDLSESEIEQIKKKLEERKRVLDDKSAVQNTSYKYLAAVKCGSSDRFDHYSKFNKQAVNRSMIRSIDHSVSKLKQIYFGTAVKKLSTWRGPFTLYAPQSCLI